MYVNRLIQEGKVKGRQIPLIKLSEKYFGPPTGLILVVPEDFPADSRPKIIGVDGRKVPLRFSLSQTWTQRHGVFTIGKSYLRARALSWDRLGPKPLLIRAQSHSGATIVLSKADQDMLTAYYRDGISLKGALLLIGNDFDQKIVSREEAFFLNRIDKDKTILDNLAPAVPDGTASWDY